MVVKMSSDCRKKKDMTENLKKPFETIDIIEQYDSKNE